MNEEQERGEQNFDGEDNEDKWDRATRLKKALEAVKNGMPKKTAAKKFALARSTIQYRLSDKFKSPGFGPGAYLSEEEEATLVR